MTTSTELMYAILAMDSYNRGYDAVINGLSENSHTTVKIGDATIIYNLIDAGIRAEAIAAGFYAIAYSYKGETVISYRGTDGAYGGK